MLNVMTVVGNVTPASSRYPNLGKQLIGFFKNGDLARTVRHSEVDGREKTRGASANDYDTMNNRTGKLMHKFDPAFDGDRTVAGVDDVEIGSRWNAFPVHRPVTGNIIIPFRFIKFSAPAVVYPYLVLWEFFYASDV